MEKKQLVIMGISPSPTANNAYALILKESDGKRRLPIIIGAFEAQAIAIELEGVIPPRPMTHDLLKSLLEAFDITLTEVYINELRDGTFYAKLIFEEVNLEIDVRPSDAIALAVRCNAPIYVSADILDETGLYPPGDDNDDDLKLMNRPHQQQQKKDAKPKSRLEYLEEQLDKAIQNEDYERAAELRDEISKLSDVK
ncbi:MAG TPA: bifunctional nuclease family protein [Candidatus Kapabacteria bacterium]|nr:bifunctional nuclease family protein [Candidatus Kapabacteria bacterium]HPO63813.1 bifunctional nuclease family protein [Candidatus Kapabacteria bacterium]